MAACVRSIALLLMLGSSCLSSRAFAANQVIQINASVAKPLEFARLQDLDLGMIALTPGTWSGATVSISNSGAFTCNSNVVCTGTAQPAMYNVQGTNKTVVRITAPSVTLVNQSNSSQTLTLILDNPGTVTLPNSGAPGLNFGIGGSITLNSTTPPGTYAGTLNVTVDF